MIFLSRFEKITDEEYLIGYTNYKPFDSISGLGKTKEELEKEGILVESIPQPEKREGKAGILRFNPIKKELFYIYVDIPKPEPDIKDRIGALEQSNAELMNLIMMQGMTPK